MNDVYTRIRSIEERVSDLTRAVREADRALPWLRNLKDTGQLSKAADGQVPGYHYATGQWRPITPTGAPAISVIAETAFGQSTAVGASLLYSRQDHTHGTPANPVIAHEGAGDPHPSYLLSVTATSPVVATAGRNPVVSMPAATAAAPGHLLAVDKAALDAKTSLATASTIMVRDAGGRTQVAIPVSPGDAVRNDDTRLTNPRTPTAHAATHLVGGTDPVALATSAATGLMPATDKAKLDAATSANTPSTLVQRSAVGAVDVGVVTAVSVTPTGLTGATAASRYAGATASGAPTTGTFAKGDFVIDQTGKVWINTVAGSPGTWASDVAGVAGVLETEAGTTLTTEAGDTLDVASITGVTFFNTRPGDVTLTSADVTVALTYTPARLVGGKVPTTELGGAGGTTSNFLRGDGTWAATNVADDTISTPVTIVTGGSIRTAAAHPRLEINPAGAGVAGGILDLTDSAGVSQLRLYNGTSGIPQVVVGPTGGSEMGMASYGSPAHLFFLSGDTDIYSAGLLYADLRLEKIGAGVTRQEQVVLEPGAYRDPAAGNVTRRRPKITLRNQSINGAINESIVISGDIDVPSNSLGFGATIRQMVNLWGTQYGVGVQANTTYFRTNGGFAWYRGGAHNDGEQQAGGGSRVLAVTSGGTFLVNDIETAGVLYKAGSPGSYGFDGAGPVISGNISAPNTLSVGSTIAGGGDINATGYVHANSGSIRMGEVSGDRGLYSANLPLRLDAASNSQIRLSLGGANHLVVRPSGSGGTETLFNNPNVAIGSAYVRIAHTGSGGAGHIDTVVGALYLNWYSGGTGGNNVIIGNGAQGNGNLLAEDISCNDVFYSGALVPSSRRFKTNIADSLNGLDAVLKMQPRTFAYKSNPDRTRHGFVWEEMLSAFPDACRGIEHDDRAAKSERESKRAIDIVPLIPTLVKAIQQIAVRLDALEARFT